MEGTSLQHQEGCSHLTGFMTGNMTGRAYETGALRAVLGPTLRPGGFSLTDRAVELCGLAPGASVLDAGCGVGATVERLRNRHSLNAVGIDLNQVLLHQGASLHWGTPLIRGDLRALPLADGAVGGVFCECVLSLFPEPQEVLSEFKRVLRRGGRLALSDMYVHKNADREAMSGLPPESCLRHAATLSGIRKNLSAAGFRVIAVEDHSHFLKRLGAELALAGSKSACCRQNGPKPGYCLFVAEKRKT